jgi:hypothetical protein
MEALQVQAILDAGGISSKISCIGALRPTMFSN